MTTRFLLFYWPKGFFFNRQQFKIELNYITLYLALYTGVKSTFQAAYMVLLLIQIFGVSSVVYTIDICFIKKS